MRPIRIVVLSLAGIAAVLLLAGPWALYGLGLYAAGGKPKPPATMASTEQQLTAWQRMRGKGAPVVPKLNPYTYFTVAVEPSPEKSGLLVAWHVASDHLREHRRYEGMLWWHLSGASLSIWLTRNWSAEQLLSKAAESRG